MKRRLTYCLNVAALFVLLWGMVYASCRYALCLRADIYSGALLQWFSSPLLATTITAGVLTLITLLAYAIIRIISRDTVLYPLALAPAIAFIALLGDINYKLTGYTPWKSTPALMWVPWGAWATIIILALLLRTRYKRGKRARIVSFSACWCIVIAYTLTLYKTTYDTGEQRFYQMAFLTGQRDWDAIIDHCKDNTLDDTRLQNCLNLALAEKGRLGDRLFYYPCQGIESIIDINTKDPLMYMIMSDIYYSMGHIAQARRLAFEANEAFGNYSPRMLQRLADTSLIYRQYALADKYLSLLESTWANRQWAQQRRKLINDDRAIAQHSELGPKVKCIPTDDHFAQTRGLDYDLWQIALANPTHTATMHYLGALCLLEKNIPKFAATVAQFYGSGMITEPLPRHFQEGIAIAAIVTGQPLDAEYRLHPSVMERCKAFWSQHQPQPNTLWHYLKNAKMP